MDTKKDLRMVNNSDLPDSDKDKEEMKENMIILDLPEVKDIPGQEHINPLPMGDLADTTISSSDEEGDGIFEDDEDDLDDKDDLDIVMGTSADVKLSEKKDLRKSANEMPIPDDENLEDAFLDNADEDGTPLNEKGFGSMVTAKDLDIPGAELDDENEDMGEEDEENNDYSVGDNK